MTSPPYYGLRDYGNPDQIGLEKTPEAYILEMVSVFREVRRVLRDDGTLWLNIGDSYGRAASTFVGGDVKEKDLIGIPWMLAFALRADGWYLRSEIIWHKPNPMPESVMDRPTKAHEQIFLLTKTPRYFYDAEAIKEAAVTPAGTKGAKGSAIRFETYGVNSRPPNYAVYDGTRNARSIWTIGSKPFKDAHFATFPPELPERCIRAGTSERGVCPVCGGPWLRRVERTSAEIIKTLRNEDRGTRTGCSGTQVTAATSRTIGWAPSCGCSSGDPVPATVLDPFAGAGTTGLAAENLSRNSILFELNLGYAAITAKRLRGADVRFA